MLNIIDWYIAKRFLGYISGALIALLTFFVAVDAMTNLLSLQPSVGALIQYYVFSAPSILTQLLPAAALIATIFTLSELNKSNELTALFSMGMSLGRISAPILMLVGLISVLSFFIGDRIIPTLNQKKNYVYYVDIKKQPGLYSTVKTNKIWYRSKNILFNIRTLNPEEGRAQGATFYYFDEAWHLIQLITAESLRINGAQWTLNNGKVTLFQEGSSFPLTQTFNEKVITVHENSVDLQSSSNSSEVLSLKELKEFIRKNKDAGLDTLRYEVDYHAKFGFAFASFVMAFLGVPFSVRLNRSGGKILGVGICLGLAFVYWSLYSSALTLGRHGVLPPIAAAWLPNFAMITTTFLFLLRLKK